MNRVRMLESRSVQRKGLHYINENLLRFSIPQSAYHVQFDLFQLAELFEQDSDGLAVITGRHNDIDILRGSPFLHPAKYAMCPNQHKWDPRSIQDADNVGWQDGGRHIVLRQRG